MKLKILPDNLALEVAAGVNLLDALSQVQIQIALDNSCGGEGICGQRRGMQDSIGS
jgi:Na+-transporting NADH:ubiquinone oxidoreductase subunit NqrF